MKAHSFCSAAEMWHFIWGGKMIPSQTSVPLGKAVSPAERRRSRGRRWWPLIPLLAALVTLAAVLLREFRPMVGPLERNSLPSNITGLANGSSIIQSNGDNASIAVDTINVGTDQAALAEIRRDREKREAQAEQDRKDRELQEKRKKDEELQRQHRTNVAKTSLEDVARTWINSIEPFQAHDIVVKLLDAPFDPDTKEMRVRGTIHWHGGLPKGDESVEKMWLFAFGTFTNGGNYPRGPREGQLELVLEEASPGEFLPKKATTFGENDAVMALTELRKTTKIGEIFFQSRSRPRR